MGFKVILGSCIGVSYAENGLDCEFFRSGVPNIFDGNYDIFDSGLEVVMVSENELLIPLSRKKSFQKM